MNAIENRDSYFDNLKIILIFLVVFGHFTNMNRDIPILSALNNVIYSFHMPLFVFISGYFSRNINSIRKQDLINLLYPYIIFEFLHYFYTRITGLGFGDLHLFTPTYQNWYLLSLFMWRLAIPLLRFGNKIVVLMCVLSLAILIGFDNQFNDFLGLYRFVFFSPFFVTGYFSQDLKSKIAFLKKFKWVFIGLFSLVTSAIFFSSYYNQTINQTLFYVYTPMFGYGGNIYNFVLRLIGLLSSTIISLIFMVIVPFGKLYFTKNGKNTITVFLLHMFLVWPLISLFDNSSTYYILYASVLSIFITMVLSSNIAMRLSQPLINLGFFSKFLKK